MRIRLVKKQEDFFKNSRDFAPNQISHGGDLGKGQRKIARPFKRNSAIHLVLKSDLATGALNMRTARNLIAVERILTKQAKRFSVKIHKEQNVGNHIHCILSCARRESFQNFLRAVAGLIARAVLGTSGKFWTQPPFTRLISAQRDYLSMLNYITKNLLEAALGKAARAEVESREELARKARRNELAKNRRKRKLA